MKTSRIYHVYDSHTAGNSTRLLLEGVPALKGRSVRERKADFQRNHDYIRTTLTQEPRGNSGILAVLVPPTHPHADYGVIFSDYRGYVDVCIHGTIGVVTTLVECGLVPERISKLQAIVFETSAGLMKTKFKFSNGKVESVTISNVPKLFLKSIYMEIPRFGMVEVSIAFGGNFYAYVNAKDMGIKIEPSNLRSLLPLARLLLEELKKTKVAHPLYTDINEVVGVSFTKNLGPKLAKNVMIAEDDLFDQISLRDGHLWKGTFAAFDRENENWRLTSKQEHHRHGILGQNIKRDEGEESTSDSARDYWQGIPDRNIRPNRVRGG